MAKVFRFPAGAELLVEQLERARAARPSRPLFAYRLEEAGRAGRHAILCSPCLNALDEPNRAFLQFAAPWALVCDFCACNNAPAVAAPGESAWRERRKG